MDATFGYHHFAHTHNDLVQGEYLSGFDAKKLKYKYEYQDKKKS